MIRNALVLSVLCTISFVRAQEFEDAVQAAPVLKGAVKEEKKHKKHADMFKKKHGQTKTPSVQQHEIKKEKKEKAQRNKKYGKQTYNTKKTRFKVHVIMARQHEQIAKHARLAQYKIRRKLRELEEKEEKLLKQENKRKNTESAKKKEQALLDVRHAQTDEEQDRADYRSGRIHGRVEHPQLKKIREQKRLCYEKLRKLSAREQEHNALADKEYQRADMPDIVTHRQIKNKEHDIITQHRREKRIRSYHYAPQELERVRAIEKQRYHHAQMLDTIDAHHKKHKKNADAKHTKHKKSAE